MLSPLLLSVFCCLSAPPEGFTHFELPGHDQAAGALNNYLWYHFDHRLGNSPVMFNKEYLTTADLWLAGAVDKAAQQPIQAVHREQLLFAQPDEEGYVPCYQHFSHAHDAGWPFPLWTQADSGHDKVLGKTAGWHFQPLDQVQGWVKGYLANWKDPQLYGEGAAAAWQVEHAKSLGIANNAWQIEVDGPEAALLSPEASTIEAFQAPFLQIRWQCDQPLAEGESLTFAWQREEDTAFAGERSVPFRPQKTPLSQALNHSILPLYKHPLWQGKIKRMRISLAPATPGAKFSLDSVFTAYDTRHTINNPIYILACRSYFNWTGDLEFLRAVMPRLRTALRYQDTVMGGQEHGRIRNTWPGHDGLAGWVRKPEGGVEVHGGHGVGGNYWDLLPFGWDDLYATNQYYASLLAMAELEQAVAAAPAWGIPAAEEAAGPEALRAQAARVRQVANELFWDKTKGRFVACIDKEGVSHDYGLTFLNLDAIWYGLANEAHSQAILQWLSGERIIDGDTSQGADIYHWRFGPRATTLRNTEWYGQGWTGPESIPWGGQVQDGGAVLGFSYYDLLARLNVLGPENAWQRLSEILQWEQEVQAAGGYRAYYADGSHGTTLQGGGSAGGLGIDFEFFESSLLPSIMTYGFLGLQPEPDALLISPRLPDSCPEMRVVDLLYRGAVLNVTASPARIQVELREAPPRPLRLRFAVPHLLDQQPVSEAVLDHAGLFSFERVQ